MLSRWKYSESIYFSSNGLNSGRPAFLLSTYHLKGT